MEGHIVISKTLEDFESALGPRREPDVSEPLKTLSEKYKDSPLKHLQTLVAGGNISRTLNTRWTTGSQPADDDGKRSVYEFVRRELDKEEFGGLEFVNRVEEAKHPLIDFSAKVWFLRKLSGIAKEEYEIWSEKPDDFIQWLEIINSSGSIFAKILADDEESLLTEISKLNYLRVILEKFLKEWKNVYRITENELSHSMRAALERHSKNFYIIPRSVPSSDRLKMYGMHFYTNKFPHDSRNVKREHAEDEAKELRQALKRYGFVMKDCDEFSPEEGDIYDLIPWFDRELPKLESQCSFLLVSFALHGREEFMRDNYYKEERILKVIKAIMTPKLDQIPKVVILQVCRTIEGDADYSDYLKNLEALLSGKNTMILFAACQGEEYECSPNQSYLFKFAQKLQEGNAEANTIESAHFHAQFPNKNKAVETTFKSADSEKEYLLPPPPSKPTDQPDDSSKD